MKGNQQKAGPARAPSRAEEARRRYWRSNVAVMSLLLFLWAAAGLGCGVLFADRLDAYHLGGFPLGFWFAQQGSIAIFVVLILIYAVTLNRLDARLRRAIREGSEDSGTP